MGNYSNFFSHYKLLMLVMGICLMLPRSFASLSELSSQRVFFDLQAYKEVTTAEYEGHPITSATLVNLNANVHTWYLLGVQGKGKDENYYNLISTSDNLRLRVSPEAPVLIISDSNKDLASCDMESEIQQPFKKRTQPKASYLPVCNNLLLIVIKQDGERSTIEKGAGVIRWLAGDVGEELINDVKENIFQDNYLVEEQIMETEDGEKKNRDNTPPSALIQSKYQKSAIPTTYLGLKTEDTDNYLLAGQWYALKNFPGFFSSMVEPGMVSQEILNRNRDHVNPLDGVENKALVYLMAFRLSHYSLGWGHGTDLPGVGWSERAVNIVKDNPFGPDGFNSIKPLITIGHTPPPLWPSTVGTISGGFQKRHSAFRYGEYSKSNKAHHYGIMENGVLFVTPSEGLATVLMNKDGTVNIKTWTKQDNELLPSLSHLRQNGLPLIERGDQGEGVPGPFVKFWGEGNWSGSANKELRTPRGAACLIETPSEKYFVYAYFSAVTPSGMARVFQAYQCNYAIQLDMNSPGQAYASLFRQKDNQVAFDIEHLMTGMTSGDYHGTPRYLIRPDYRDFFYILKKTGQNVATP